MPEVLGKKADMERLENLIKELPPDLQQEVADIVQFLLTKRGK